jgi:hypothetical protein
VTTHERELVSPVDLATPDGRRLSPEATGWSRQPLHAANLRGGWGRTKRWDYWAVLAGDLLISLTYADVDYLGIVDVWWAELGAAIDGVDPGATGRSEVPSAVRTGGANVLAPLARGVSLPERPGTVPLRFTNRRLSVEIADRADGTVDLQASWVERDGSPGRLEVAVAQPPGHESLNVVIPWSGRRFQFTSKHQARPASGWLSVGEQRWMIGANDDAWGVLDVGRGRWPYATRWNWAGGAGRGHWEQVGSGTPIVGLQLGGKWTQGTGATENGLIIDGVLQKIGRELDWTYSWDDPLAPWHVVDPGGQLDLVLHPRYDKHSRTNLGVLATETHQVFGTWSGRVVTDDGRVATLDGLQGFAEESRSRW